VTRRVELRALGPVTEDQLALAWHSAALLLGPPCEALLSQLEPIHRATHRLHDTLGGPLRSTVVHLERASLPQLEEEYANAFEGPDVILAEGFSALLERAAAADVRTGQSLLRSAWPALGPLRRSLLSAQSGWAGVVNAIAVTLEVHRDAWWVGAPHERVDS
jgi:nitrate reductase assembly molybdenum cofactor insertion protein NarJ